MKGFFTSLIPPTNPDGSKAFIWDPKPKVIATSLLNLYSPGLCFCATLFYTLASNVKVVEGSGETHFPPPDTEELTNTERKNITTHSPDHLSKGVSIDNKIEINDIQMLKKIGANGSFPPDGNYELTADLDGSSFTKAIATFNGELNGRNHTISNIKCNLINYLRDGTVRNLIINNANCTENTHCLASIACIATGNSIISNVQIKNSHLYGTILYAYWLGGTVVGGLDDSARIENSNVENCTMTIEKEIRWVGGLTGKMGGVSQSLNNTINRISINIETPKVFSGCLVGVLQGDALISNNKVFNCSLVNNRFSSDSGGVAGRVRTSAKIRSVTVSESRVEVNKRNSNAGVGVGIAEYVGVGVSVDKYASLSESTAINSTAIATHEGSHAGIWAGQSHKNFNLYNNTAINCTAETPTPRETTTTAAPTPAPREATTTANLAIVESEMVVDGASCWPLALLLSGATVTAIGAVYFAGSFYNGFQAGKRGRHLAAHPFRSFGTLFTNCYRQCCSDFLRVPTMPSQEDDLQPADHLPGRITPPPSYEEWEMMEMLPSTYETR